VALGDVNGDGKPDLVVTNGSSASVGVLLGNGNGTFQPQQTFASGGSSPWAVAAADVNGDGLPDLLVGNEFGAPPVLPQTGSATYTLIGNTDPTDTSGNTGVLGLASLFPLWGMLHDYQRRRILTLIDPTQDPLGAGYHTIQSTIAVGSGGLTGKGWLHGTQTHLEFIPERHTDFIFAVFSEEFGLIGNALLVTLYLLLIARGLMIAANAATFFARLLACAVTLMFFTYAFVNMGMVSGILPVVGVPLPFISYGGTALLTLFIGIGILMSVHSHRRLVQT